MVVFVIRDISITQIPEPKKQEKSYYSNLPNKYDPVTWPSYTDLQCYNCTLTFKRIPIFVPVGRSPSGKLERGSNPIFCSVPCLFRSILDKNLDLSLHKRYMDLVADLVKQITGEDIELPIPAGDRSTLKRFGGNKTDYDFQSEIMKFCCHIEKFYANTHDYLQDCK